MQVFKAYIKIINKTKMQIIIYLIIFLVMAILFSASSMNDKEMGFTTVKTKIAFINQDGDSPLSDGLKEYLQKYTTFVSIKEEKKAQKDALFFRDVEYIVKVPSGFSKNFMAGKNEELEKTGIPGTASDVYVDALINKYLNTVHLYRETLPEISEKEIIAYTKADLQKKSSVVFKGGKEVKGVRQACNFYFDFLNYIIIMIMIFGVSAPMAALSKIDLRRRNQASPITIINFNGQLILGNVFLLIVGWVVLMIPSFIMYPEIMTSKTGAFLLLNSFLLCMSALSIGYLLSLVVKSTNALNGIANVLGLGSSFISGAFVPQAMLNKSVLFFSSFTPAYWYIKSNDSIISMESFKMENLQPVFANMLVILGFAVVIFIVALVYAKFKRTD